MVQYSTKIDPLIGGTGICFDLPQLSSRRRVYDLACQRISFFLGFFSYIFLELFVFDVKHIDEAVFQSAISGSSYLDGQYNE